jgi:aminobenzoyl-glutamate utilization protein B
MNLSKENLVRWIEEHQERFTSIAKQIWQRPEIAYEEKFASRVQIDALTDAGFAVQESVGGLPTAFIAQYGSGKPIIGIIGEFDALPGLSQQISTTQQRADSGDAGHGCGHHLLGTAGVEAAIALKHAIDEEKLIGTIRYYGCPAEEVLSGKTFMAKAGAFDDLDAALTWHPGTSNLSAYSSSSALTSVEFHFQGRTAHAGIAAHLGRSALDAVEIMNVGANYLREHVPDGYKFHYSITNGGVAPNIVPDKASVWYFLRASSREQVDGLFDRIVKVAQGAAFMTETEVSWDIKAGAYDFRPNETLNDLLFRQKDYAGQLVFSKKEKEWAASLVASLDPAALRSSLAFHSKLGFEEDEILPTAFAKYKPLASFGGSSDIGDVSWITPVGTINTTCAPIGVALHTWQATAAFGSTIGLKGMHHAAKLLASAVYELLTEGAATLEQAKAEWLRNTDNKSYVPGIPTGVRAPVPA